MTQKCPYCGFEFEETHQYCHTSCPLSKSCGMMMCPNCRYEFTPPHSAIVDFFKKMFSSGKSKIPKTDSLST